MKKIFTLFLSVILIFMISATVSADYRGAVENINMVSGLNPVVNLIEDGKFEYIIYARDMQNMTNGDFTVTFAENTEFVSLKQTGTYDMCFYNVIDNTVKISFMYNEYNSDASLKMFVLTFSYTGTPAYPVLKVTNIAGTYIKSVADVIVIREQTTEKPSFLLKGDVDMNKRVTAADARLALRHSAKLTTLSGNQFSNADVNADKIVSATDARLILRFAAGIDKTL